MEILHVIPSVSPVHGGPSRAIEVMEMSLSDGGVGVTTLTTDDDGPGRRLPYEARVSAAVGVTRVYSRKITEFYKIAPGMVLWLWRNVRQFDVVHIHALFSFSSTVCAIIAHLRGVPYIVRPLGTLTSYGTKQRRPWLKAASLALIERPILRRAAVVHFTSVAEWDEVNALGIKCRGAVVGLGVENECRNRVRATRDESAWRACPRTLLYLSRLDRKKNVEQLLRSVEWLGTEGIRPVLLIAGSGSDDYILELKNLALSLGISEQIVWLGHVEGCRKIDVLASAEIFVLPSFNENFGIAAVEAMLAGLPCVLSEGVAVARDAAAAGAVIAVKPTTEAIGRAIARLLLDDSLRLEMGLRASRFARERFSVKSMADELIRLYKDVAGGPEGAKR